jgi:hypothetical protein
MGSLVSLRIVAQLVIFLAGLIAFWVLASPYISNGAFPIGLLFGMVWMLASGAIAQKMCGEP